MFESLGETSDKAVEKAQHYIETTKAYYRLKAFQQVSTIIGVMGKAMVIGGMAFIGFLFLAIAAAIGLGRLFDSIALGSLTVGIIFLILGYIAYKKRGLIDTQVIKQMSPKFFESK